MMEAQSDEGEKEDIEFSFTNISLQDFTDQLPSPFDLSPADDIFFHGHLLPLHHLPHHRSSSSSSSFSSSDTTFTLKALNNDESSHDHLMRIEIHDNIPKISQGKSRAFPHLFAKRRKDQDRDAEHNPKLWKSKFDMVKKLVKPFSINLFRHKRAESSSSSSSSSNNNMSNHEFLRQPEPFNDYSGSLRERKRKNFVVRGRRSKFASAPVSKITSPSNSGPLVATTLTHKSDSAVEELQSAIQAAIAHCKKSVNEN